MTLPSSPTWKRRWRWRPPSTGPRLAVRISSASMRVDQEAVRIQEFAEGPRPFRALYEHWERHQWSPLAIDFSVDAATFAGLDAETRDRLVWVYAHR